METNKENEGVKSENPWNGVSTLCESKSSSQTDENKKKVEVRNHSQSSRDNAIEEDLLPGKKTTLSKEDALKLQRIFFIFYMIPNIITLYVLYLHQ